MHDTSCRIIRNTNFYPLYEKLLHKLDLSEEEYTKILQIAVIFLNNENPDLQDLGYRIIILYSNHTQDFLPLYDVAVNSGFAPILKLLEEREKFAKVKEESFFNSFYSSLLENYKHENIYFTNAQLELTKFFKRERTNNVAIVAPTSYGKSELIVTFCNENTDSNIVIVVPTKALLAQTKRRLVEGLNDTDRRKIITHPEMYSQDQTAFIGVLTQERLLRLYQKHSDISFDFAFIDEAHNLLGDDQRSLLLAKVIILLKNRCENIVFKYLTPFLISSQNIKTKYSSFEISEFNVKENLKTEKFYLVDFRKNGKLNIYDQFFDKFSEVPVTNCENEISFIKTNSSLKNIIYINTPPKVEKFAKEYIDSLPNIVDAEINLICQNISEFLHEDYLLIDCLKKGVVYHHGSVPDIVKLYIEKKYTSIPSIKHIITTSTLLEGVNIPAQKLFLLDIRKGRRKLSRSQFKNLVGRICRFKEIFSSGNIGLEMLEPEIYIIGTENYLPKNANISNFLKSSTQVDLRIQDNPENVLLDTTILNDKNEKAKKDADEYLENLQEGITGENVRYATTSIGKSCFLNNVSEIDILFNEIDMDRIVNDLSDNNISNASDLIKIISRIFIPFLRENKFDFLRRLEQEPAQIFYAMFLSWRIQNVSFSQMISTFLAYWNRIEFSEVYVGKWGDIRRDGSWSESWTNIKQKEHKEKVNLAIVRIKEEQDFLDNHILKFIEILNDLNKLNDDLYLKIKYGTTDQNRIALINNGMHAHLATVLLENYSDYIEIDLSSKSVTVDPAIVEQMIANHENDILIFEIGFHVR